MTSDKKYVTVPVEPTEEMLTAAIYAHVETEDKIGHEKWVVGYKAMLAARPCAEGLDLNQLQYDTYEAIGLLAEGMEDKRDCRIYVSKAIKYLAARNLLSVSPAGDEK